MRSGILCTLMLLCLALSAKGQQGASITATKDSAFRDTAFIESYTQELVLRLYQINKSNGFSLSGLEDARVAYSSNDRYNVGFGFNYRWLGLNLAFNIPAINADETEKGLTQSLDLQIASYGRRNVFDGYLQVYKGYYQSNPDAYLDDWVEGMPFPRRGDAITFNLGASFLHLFNYKRFSFRAPFLQNERQLRSSGSFLLGGFFSLYALQADSSLLPEQAQSRFPAIGSNISEANLSFIGVSAGYAHTFIVKKSFFFTLALTPGLGVGSLGYIAKKEEASDVTRLAARLLARVALGYNSERLVIGVTGVSDTYGVLVHEDLGFQYVVGQGRVFLSYRFRVKKS